MQMIDLLRQIDKLEKHSETRIVKESLDECGMMGSSYSDMNRPKVPATINITADSGEELGDLLKIITHIAGHDHRSEIDHDSSTISSTPSIGVSSIDNTDMTKMIDRLNDIDDEEADDSDSSIDDEERFKETYGTEPNPEIRDMPPGNQDPAGTPGAAQGRNQMNNPVATPEEFMYECLRQDYQKFLADARYGGRSSWDTSSTGWQSDEERRGRYKERDFAHGAQDIPAPKTPAPDGYKWGIKNVYTKNWINDDDGVPMGWEYKEDAKDAMERMSIDKGLAIYKHDIMAFKPNGESKA